MKLAASLSFLAMLLCIVVGAMFDWIGYRPPSWVSLAAVSIIVFGSGVVLGHLSAGDDR